MTQSKKAYFASLFFIFIILGIYFFHPIDMIVANDDLGRHLTLGKIILNTGKVPLTNFLSYTFPNFPFINTHWLSQIIYYLLYQHFGITSLIFLSTSVIILTFFITFTMSLRKSNLFAVLLLSLLYLQLLSQRTEVRPELFSFLLLSFFNTILYKNREKYTKWIFVLIPLELFWVNLHIYFFVGIILLVLFIIDALIRKETFSSQKFSALMIVTLGSLIATLINPNFIMGASYPLFVLNNYGYQVSENVNYFLAMSTPHDSTMIYFGILVIILGGTLVLARKKMDWIDIFIFLFFTFMGVFAIRDFPLFIFGTFYPACKAITIAISSLKIENKKYLTYAQNGTLIVAFLLLLPTIQATINDDGLGGGIVNNANAAVNFLLQNNIKGPIYNNFDVGSYLEYRLYPEERVFVDSRPEAYPAAFFQNTYIPMQLSSQSFDDIANHFHFNVIFLEYPDSSYEITPNLLYNLARSNRWKMVYLNSEIVIFLKNTLANRSIIASHLITSDNVKITESDYNNKQKVQQLANFFKYVDWENPLLDSNLRYLQFDPSNCIALQTVAYIYQQESQIEASQIYVHKYINASCDASHLE